MRRYTDLPGVKAVARMLLAQDIQPTAHAPVIVSHPFTSSGIVGLREADGNITFGDLMGSPDDLARWRQMVGEQIDGADSAISILSLLNRSYYMAFIKYAAPYLSEKDLGQLLSNAWILNETPNPDPNIGKRELVSLFRSVSPQHLMDEEELRRYQELDDPVTVYRGVTSYNAKNIRALSWTPRSGLPTDLVRRASSTRPRSRKNISSPFSITGARLKSCWTRSIWSRSWSPRNQKWGCG